MKSDRAIEILSCMVVPIHPIHKKERKDAIKLGIEALRCLERLHNLPYGSPLPPLPGETKE